MAKKRHEFIAAVISIYLCCCLFYFIISFVIFTWTLQHNLFDPFFEVENKDDLSGPFSAVHRKLLTIPDEESMPNTSTAVNNIPNVNCSPPSIEQFPRPLMSYSTRRNGGLLIHVLVALYMFLGLAIICDEYFVPSLERICKFLDMQPDVAGATFMAAGSSAPELATAVIAVFIAKDDIGIGTVVGSAVFNIAFVIGVCGLFAGRIVYLNWWPMFRDCIFYLISILALLWALRDETVTWVESVLFLSLYALYISFMLINRRVEKWITKFAFFSRFGSKVSDPDDGVTYHPLPDVAQAHIESDKFTTASTEVLSNAELSQETLEEDEEGSVFTPPRGRLKCICWVISLPFLALCFITVPDCRKRKWKKCLFVAFLMSCIWIAALSYVLVWMITIIGFTLNIKETIMGLTFMAFGASIPDAISSLLVARDGFGDMAVSNAVGSNVFDILLCLGLPWFLQTAIVEPGSKIIVRSRGLTYSTCTLLLTVIFLLVATHCNGWKLSRKYGAILLAWYALFMVIATMYELDIFGAVSLPSCPSDF